MLLDTHVAEMPFQFPAGVVDQNTERGVSSGDMVGRAVWGAVETGIGCLDSRGVCEVSVCLGS